MSPFASLIREYRCIRGITQKDAADILGCEQSYISAIERGYKGLPKKQFIDRLIRGYGLTEKEVVDLNNTLKVSERKLLLPVNSRSEEYRLLHLLKQKIGQLQPHQIDLIEIVLKCEQGKPAHEELHV